MSLRDHFELANTREKLHRLGRLYGEVEQRPTEDAHVRELILRSLRRQINQMKEEIARFESRPAATP